MVWLAYCNGLPNNRKITDLMKCIQCQWNGSVLSRVTKMLYSKIWKGVSWWALLEDVLKSLWLETLSRWDKMRFVRLWRLALCLLCELHFVVFRWVSWKQGRYVFWLPVFLQVIVVSLHERWENTLWYRDFSHQLPLDPLQEKWRTDNKSISSKQLQTSQKRWR